MDVGTRKVWEDGKHRKTSIDAPPSPHPQWAQPQPQAQAKPVGVGVAEGGLETGEAGATPAEDHEGDGMVEAQEEGDGTGLELAAITPPNRHREDSTSYDQVEV